MIDRLAIIGVGLIGGSMARALREEGAVREIVGCGRGRANLERAVALGVVDRGYALLTRPPEPGARFGELVRDPATVTAGERLHARLAGGVLAVTVEGPVEDPDPAAKGGT